MSTYTKMSRGGGGCPGGGGGYSIQGRFDLGTFLMGNICMNGGP